MSVFAVPRSIARSLEKSPYSQSKIIGRLPRSSLQNYTLTDRQNLLPDERRDLSQTEARSRPAGRLEGSSRVSRTGGARQLPLGDLAFLVREVLAADRAVFLDLELFRHRPLVL